jgi:DNA-binding response OmpR family regulator
MKPGILVIEDDRPVAEALATVLGDEFDVTIADDGLAAWHLLARSYSPDLVLLDLKMPNMGGCELLRKIRAHSQHATLPVALITSDRLHAETCPSCKEFATHVLLKPFELEKLERLVEGYSLKRASG